MSQYSTQQQQQQQTMNGNVNSQQPTMCTTQQGFNVSSEYLSKPPIYYNTFTNMNQASNVLNSQSNLNANANNNKNMMLNNANINYAANSGRLSAVIDAMGNSKIQLQQQQRAPSALGCNNTLLNQMQPQQQQYENASADQISYFDTAATTPPPSIYNPSLKPSESGRLSRRQKSTPSTVHFASPLVTPIPYMTEAASSRCYDETKENLDSSQQQMAAMMRERKRQLHKESRSHSTIPAYRYKNLIFNSLLLLLKTL